MELKREHPNKSKKLVGRGGTRGKTSGRGTKGQNARAGHKNRPELRDIIKKLPKHRGYRFASIQNKPDIINLAKIERAFESGETVSPLVLIERKIVSLKKGRLPVIKILANGDLTKKLTIVGCQFSESVLAKVEKAGGKIS